MFCAGVMLDLFLCAGLNRLVYVLGSNVIWFLCSGRKWLVSSVAIDLVSFCMGGQNWLGFYVQAGDHFVVE